MNSNNNDIHFFEMLRKDIIDIGTEQKESLKMRNKKTNNEEQKKKT